MADFFSGKRQNSGREGFPVFVGDDLRAAKWRNWKVHFGWAPTKYDPVLRYSTAPKVVDLTRDPRETTDIAGRSPELVSELLAMLDAWEQTYGRGTDGGNSIELDEETVARLRSLGYVQ